MSSTNTLAIVVLALLIIVVAPLAVIWSLNTLFGLAIAYTWQTWLSVVLLQAWIQSMFTVAKNRG